MSWLSEQWEGATDWVDDTLGTSIGKMSKEIVREYEDFAAEYKRQYTDIGTELVRQDLKILEEQQRIQHQLDRALGKGQPVIQKPAGQDTKEIGMPFQTGQAIGVQTEIDSWAWAKKYLKAQRQVAQAKALLPEPAPQPAEELTVQELVVPAAALVLVWWLVA